MDAQRKRLARTIKRIKTALTTGDVVTFASVLRDEGCVLTLTAIREQKILLRIPLQDWQAVTALLITASESLLEPAEAERFGRYLIFLYQFRSAQIGVQARLDAVLRSSPKINLEELTGIAGEVFRQFFKDLSPPIPESSQTVADYERQLHDLNGYGNDVIHAVLRALNEASKFALDVDSPGLNRSERRTVERRLLGAARISAELNALEWVLDSVSYGDLVIAQVEQGRKFTVRLDHADTRRTLIRVLAIRRNLILNYNRARAPRFVRDMLATLEIPALESALESYCNLAKIHPDTMEFAKLRWLSAGVLTLVGAGDDLLFVACKGDAFVLVYYTVAMMLQWCSLTADAVRDALSPGERRHFLSPPIPLEHIAGGIKGGDRKDIDEALASLTCTLPARSHYDLARRPFFRDGPNFARRVALPFIDPWTTSVRDALVNGGRVGDAYGRVWEDFFWRSFEESDWEILGRNLQLRENGRLVTDVDLLTKRGDLLLVVQIKAIVGAGVSPYDHWRNRQTIEWGCRQAVAAASFLGRTPHWLVSVAGRAKAGEVRHIQPLVLTTLNHVDGWKFEGVPIIGEIGRKAITQGSKVIYSNPQTGEIIATRHITKPEELSTERILWALENPVELLIAPERPNTTYRVAAAGGLHFELPQFQIGTSKYDVLVTQPAGQ